MFFISVVKQYERAVIFRLGRYIGTRGPGLVILIPFLDRGVRVDQREIVLDEPAQSSITKDNALVDIDFVVYMRVVDAEAAVININNYIRAVRNMATTTLRSVIGDITVEEVLSRALPEAEPAALRRSARVLWCGVHGICSLALTGKLGLVTSESVRVMIESLVRNYLDGLRNGEVRTSNKA